MYVDSVLQGDYNYYIKNSNNNSYMDAYVHYLRQIDEAMMLSMDIISSCCDESSRALACTAEGRGCALFSTSHPSPLHNT